MVVTVCLCMYVVGNTKFSGHWLSEVNTLEMKNCHTHLVFIRKTFNSTVNISTKPQNTGKVPFASVPNIHLARQMSNNNR